MNAKRKSNIRVAIIDDHDLVRRGIKEALQDAKSFTIVAEGASADDAVAIDRAHEPDVSLIDINMPGNGIAAVRQIVDKRPAAKILMLTVFDNMGSVIESLQAGASGYVLKGVSGDELAEVVSKINDGAKHVGPELAAKLFLEFDLPTLVSTSKSENVDTANLNAREIGIMDLLAASKTNAEIAEVLGLTEATIKNYTSRIFTKLGVKNRTEAALLWNRSL